jgi:queuine/archaeosine tRNA-ribosyltransferase
LTEHNLAFLARLIGELRQAIVDGQLSVLAAELLGGE